MKLTPHPRFNMQTWCSRICVVIFGFAFALAIVSAQESKPDVSSTNSGATKPDAVNQKPATPKPETKMPDISGTWRNPKDLNSGNIEIHRVDDGSADFRFNNPAGQLIPGPRIIWSQNTQRFEQFIFDPDYKAPAKRTLELLPDGKTMKVTVSFDATLQNELVQDGSITEKEQRELLNQEWIRTEPLTPKTAGPIEAEFEPVDPLKPLRVGLVPATPLLKEVVEVFGPRGAKVLVFEAGQRLKIEAPKEVMEDLGKLLELVGQEYRKQSKPQPPPAAENSRVVDLYPATLLTKNLFKVFEPRGAKVRQFVPEKYLQVEAPGDVFLDLEKILRLVSNERQKQADLRRTLGLPQSVSASEHPEKNAATLTPEDQSPASPVGDSKMPDISGTWKWQLPKSTFPEVDGAKVVYRTYIIRRAEKRRAGDNYVADFVLQGRQLVPTDLGVQFLGLKWSPTSRRFEPIMPNEGPASAMKLELLPGGKVLRVSWDKVLIKGERRPDPDRNRTHFIEWERQDDSVDEGNDSPNTPPRHTGPASDRQQSSDSKPDDLWHDADVPYNSLEVVSVEGVWQAGDWGIVTIRRQVAPDESRDGTDGMQVKGTSIDKSGKARRDFVLTLSERRPRFEGTWHELQGDGPGGQSGRLSLRALETGKTIRGSWKTDTDAATKSEISEFGDFEWVRLGRIDSHFTPEPPPSAPADFQQFERSQVQTIKTRPLPSSSFTPSAAILKIPGAIELLETLAQHEAMADALVQTIRQAANSEGDQNSRQAEARRDLELTLTDALQVKFQLEQMQIKLLEEQLELLKTQVSQRQAARKQIVKRRARELIEETSKWNPTAPATTDDFATPRKP
jgi:hypothetical protein